MSSLSSTAVPPAPDRFAQAGAAFAELCRTMARLRGPGGCAWDAEQSPESLLPYLLEEVHEAIEAVEAGRPEAICEELGDVLLQVVFHAEIAQETAAFDATTLVRGLDAKLRRRHPHVFGTAPAAADAEAALARWERLKADEHPPERSRLDGVPRALPGLLRAARVSEKAAATGFDWPDSAGAAAKVAEEWEELQQAMAGADPAAVADEMGDVLFALSSLCRHLRLDPEAALRRAIDKFQGRFRHMEAACRAAGEALEGQPPARQEALWQDAKRAARGGA